MLTTFEVVARKKTIQTNFFLLETKKHGRPCQPREGLKSDSMERKTEYSVDIHNQNYIIKIELRLFKMGHFIDSSVFTFNKINNNNGRKAYLCSQ